MAYIDLSHTIFDGLVTYKGLPAPIICDYLSREQSRSIYEPGTEFQIARIEMVANTGTYIDCPFHRYEQGKDLAEMPLERFADLPALLIEAPCTHELAIGNSYFEGKNIAGKAILIHTGWSKHWNTEAYYQNHPYLTADAAQFLSDNKVQLVGIDSYNIDNTSHNSRPAHSILLGNEILIVEHLCQLHLLPQSGFTFSAVPPKFKGVGTFPVRAFATVNA